MSKTKKAPSQKGYIYVFSNDKHNGICKVGRTTIHPTERARQLTRHLAKSLVERGEFEVVGEVGVFVRRMSVIGVFIHYINLILYDKDNIIHFIYFNGSLRS